MTKKIHLNKKDFYRVVLTDTLPYEVPFILTNEGFYRSLIDGFIENDPVFHDIFRQKGINNNPLLYKISKDSSSERSLYLVHPSKQVDICELYARYNQLISNLCSRSSFSLRYPYKVASSYYINEFNEYDYEQYFKDEGVNIDSPKYASTFFEYKDFGFLYKFYDSYHFHRIEKKFNKLFKFDVSKCFSSISTYQLAKSLRDVESYNASKEFYNFENEFERLMNEINYGDGHGVVVGPEFSRIFSEILLQSIDVEIKNKLKKEPYNILENVDYVIKRYVDDFFLFYNDDAVKDNVFKVVVDKLDYYKLYINESKNELSSVPFITGVTIAKQQYRKLISEFFDKLVLKGDIKGISSPMNRYFQISNQIITDIKGIVFGNDISYSSISGYFFTLAKVKVSEINDHVDEFINDRVQCDKITNYLSIIIEVSFFVYCMDFRVRSTYLISQIIILINKISSVLGDDNHSFIKKKIYDEAYLAIKISRNKKTFKDIECLNLLIAIRDIDLDYQLEKDIVESILVSDKEANYFSLMTCLFYIQNKKSYTLIKKKVVGIITHKLSESKLRGFTDSELVHVIFDSISCPYLTDLMKFNIAKNAFSAIVSDDDQIKALVEKISSRNWFIDWTTPSQGSIERLLMKKELKATYGS